MSHPKYHIIYFFVIVLLLGLLGFLLSSPKKVVEVIQKQTDTLIITKIDTMTITKFIEVEKTIVDTHYVHLRDSIFVPIPISEYRFFEDGFYDIMAKGYMVSLSSVKVFPKIEYKYITNTIERKVTSQEWDLYLGGGFWGFNNVLIPNIGLGVKAPKSFLFMANIGYFKGQPMGGGSIYYNLTQ